MKKSYLLSGMIAFSLVIGVSGLKGMEEQRPEEYKEIDSLLNKNPNNWADILNLLDSLIETKNLTADDYRADKGGTLLMYAVGQNNLKAVKILLTIYKANPNIGDFSGMNPLMVACTANYARMVKLLLKHGANPTVQDQHGYDSFDYASSYPEILLLLRIRLGQQSARAA